MKYLSIILVSSLLGNLVIGQPYCTDSVGISTDPRPGKAYNLERPTLANTFDWMNDSIQPVHLYGPAYSGTTYFNSPYYNNNYDLLFLAKEDTSDFYPEEGWELIHWGFGKTVNGGNDAYDRQLPYLILYNRHTGMLHVFGASDLTGYDVFEIELSFTESSPNRLSYGPAGLFGYMNSIAQVLDDSTRITQVKGAFNHPNQTLKFVHAAFPMAYDPCVCFNQSAFSVKFWLVEESDIKLYGRLLGTQTDLLTYYPGVGGTPYFHPDFLSTVFTNGYDVETGTQIYKQAGDIYNDLIPVMGAKGKFDIVAALDVLKTFIDLGVEVAGIIPGGKEASVPLKIASKAINFSQSVIRFKKSGQPARPSKAIPAIIKAEVTMTGTLVDTEGQLVSEIAVPGSLGTNTLPEANYTLQPYYPLYNEELGVFALLETPVVNRYVMQSYSTSGNCNSLDETEIVTENISYRLASAIKYAINPAARIDFSQSEISAALVIKSPSEEPYNLSNGSYSHVIEYGNLEEGVGDYTYISPFLPLECLENLSVYLDKYHYFSSLNCAGSGYSPDSDTIYLRFANVYLSSTLDSKGLPNVSLQTVTFPVKIQEVTSPLPASAVLPFEKNISGVLTTDQKAWRKITVTGNISAANPVLVSAGEEIVVPPNALILPNIELVPGVTPMSCGSVNLPKDPAWLNTYCTSSQYKAGQLSAKAQQHQSASEIAKLIPLTAFPNPFTGEITLQFDLPETTVVSIILYDLLGRPVMPILKGEAMKAGPQKLTVEMGFLAAGLYHVVLEAGGQRQAVKVVKE